jgi:hypothetical protein
VFLPAFPLDPPNFLFPQLGQIDPAPGCLANGDNRIAIFNSKIPD